jgi:hypothetical protein
VESRGFELASYSTLTVNSNDPVLSTVKYRPPSRPHKSVPQLKIIPIESGYFPSYLVNFYDTITPCLNITIREFPPN